MGKQKMSEIENNHNESISKEHHLVFINRMVVYTIVCFIFVIVIGSFDANLTSGLYFLPFVMSLLNLEHLNKRYQVNVRKFIALPTMGYLFVYYICYTYLFLILNNISFHLGDFINMILAHYIHFLIAIFVSSFYAKIRLRKKNKRAEE